MWTAAVLHAYVPAERKSKLIYTTEHTHMLTLKTKPLTMPGPYFYHICILDWLDLYSMIVNDIIFGFSVLGAQCRAVPLCFTISIV